MEHSNEWLRFVCMDTMTAKHMSTHHPVPVEVVCFHCQQAVEKMLKAVLVRHDTEVPKIHSLVALLKLAMPYEPSFEKLQYQCSVLTQYAVVSRYPPAYDHTTDDMHLALKALADVLSVAKTAGYSVEA